MGPSEEVSVYRTSSSSEARSLAAALENEGIEAHVVGEALQGAYAGLNIGGISEVEVWIRKSDRGRADAVIANLREKAGGDGGLPRGMSNRGPLLMMLTVLGLLGALLVL